MGWYAFNDKQKQKIIYTFYVLPHMKYENKPLQNHAMFVRFIELIFVCFFFFQPLHVHLPLQRTCALLKQEQRKRRHRQVQLQRFQKNLERLGKTATAKGMFFFLTINFLWAVNLVIFWTEIWKCFCFLQRCTKKNQFIELCNFVFVFFQPLHLVPLTELSPCKCRLHLNWFIHQPSLAAVIDSGSTWRHRTTDSLNFYLRLVWTLPSPFEAPAQPQQVAPLPRPAY